MSRGTRPFLDTPGAICALPMQHGKGTLVVIDRSQDTWERVARETPEKDEGLLRYAVWHEPSGRAVTCKTSVKARELAAEVSAMFRKEAATMIESWEPFLPVSALPA
jgi:hypothetical protein